MLSCLLLSAAARGGVTEEEAARLEGDLTPVGAERAGNAAGTIPPWTGGITEPPPGYAEGKWHPDPYAADERLLTITAANVVDHAEHLSPGQQALLRAHPETWRMHVYPTRRSASFPPFVYEAIRANAASASLVHSEKGGVADARVSSPFPLPASGVEVIWNHNLRFRGIAVARAQGSAAVTQLGNYRILLSVQQLAFPYSAPDATAFTHQYPNVLLAAKSKTIQPSLVSGDALLLLEPIDQTDDPRRVWRYSRDLRRVLRSPYFAYDFPAPGSENLLTVDDFELFLGPPDRFEWKLLGKREMYIPYNAYRLHGNADHEEILGVSHIDPDLARYELHRVWVVEGTLRDGMEHVYGKRVFYVDEDSWQIAVADSYDLEGNLWRVNEAHALNYYEVPVHWATLQVFHDLEVRRYYATGLDNGRNPPRFSDGADPREFSPNALLLYIR